MKDEFNFEKIVLFSDFNDLEKVLELKPDLVLLNKKELSEFKENKAEIFRAFDGRENFLCYASRSVCHLTGLWHESVHVFVFNEKNQLLLQKRARNKRFLPNVFAASVCEHNVLGESLKQTALRGLMEELGIEKCSGLKKFGEVRLELESDCGKEKEFLSLFKCKIKESDAKIKFDPNETQFVKFFDLKELFEFKWGELGDLMRKELLLYKENAM